MTIAKATCHTLRFIKPAGTSRGILNVKPSWFITLHDTLSGNTGIGECGLLPGLSADDRAGYEARVQEVCDAINQNAPIPDLVEWPSIRFGLEMALLDLDNPATGVLIPSPFTRGESGININGLVWMNTPAEMAVQIDQKLAEGYTCIKLKIGAVNWSDELNLIEGIRKRYTAEQITIRVDANGAFAPGVAPAKLKQLSAFDIHSIEQPIRAGQWEQLADLSVNSPIPIALDEELIGCYHPDECERLIDAIRPQYVVLKPSLIGGFAMSDLWINLASQYSAGWWITSALESNVGLSAIAQYCASKPLNMPQGLGTGVLFYNNFDGPLKISKGSLYYHPELRWNYDHLI
jgi:L-alanine-DL-glutamate epimerase-like enolase superfamily enzyme